MRELTATHSFQLAQADPDVATASSRSAGRFEWAITYRRGSGCFRVEAIGRGRRCGFALELEDGSVRVFDAKPLLGRGLQAIRCHPRVMVARGGGPGFVIVDDWWEAADGDCV